MTKTFFAIDDDVYVKGRWFLNGLYDDSGIELDSRAFTYGLPIDRSSPLALPRAADGVPVSVNQPLKVSARQNGMPLEFTFADFDMPIVTADVADLLAELAGASIQRFPVQIDGQLRSYEIINVVSLVDCIDRTRSEIDWYEEGNDERPDLAGTPQLITKLVIDPALTLGNQVLRPEGWEITVIVSEVVKVALESRRVSGITFRRV